MTIIVKYNMVCEYCGEYNGEDWHDSGLEALRSAARSGWGEMYTMHYCHGCIVFRGEKGLADPDMRLLSEIKPPSLKGSPPGYSPPMLICSCGTRTSRQEGKCRECKKELAIETANDELF